MQRRLLLVLALLVTVPTLTVVTLGWRMLENQRRVARMELETLLDERLADLEQTIAAELTRLEQDLATELEPERDGLLGTPPTSAEALRQLRRESGLVGMAFVLDPQGNLTYPPAAGPRSEDEDAFMVRTRDIWAGRAVLYEPPTPEPNVELKKRVSRSSARIAGDDMVSLAVRRPQGWIAWYWQDGLHLLFWRRLESGGVIGVEVERVVLLARILGRLPSLPVGEDRIVLVDSRGDAVHQWGPYEVPAGEAAVTERRLPYPLDGYRLAYHLAPARGAALLGASTPLGTLAGLGALVLALLGLGVYAYRESSRQVREAAQRVTFVTQVSHELKTPLANIRLYAELLDADLEDEGGPRERVGVIVSESQRLARLIDNVLVYAKVRRGTHRVTPVPMRMDDAVGRVLTQFGPALAAKGIEPEVTLGAPAPCRADPDAVEQILANLVNNVEKYGASGGVLIVRTEQDAAVTRVVVGDRGPGVPAAARARIFEPFYRVSHKLSDAVTGTGIGLAIARTLAEECGGRLALLEDRGPGAWFALEVPGVREEEA
ncbi:MAG: HAMP domain-containing histidine kinase [Myxococcales bacterium]|nr:HAMP domain-containing histidine kinase [Myxococcales bacterium]MCB9645915.1 HAMP domain-containing histidine kinase [Deltaproteobacteria bacterium]